MFYFLIALAIVLGLWLPYLNLLEGITISLLFILYVIYKRKCHHHFWVIFLILLGCLIISLIKIPVNTEKESFYGIVISSKENYFIIQSGFHRYYIYEKNNLKEFGDIIFVNGHLSELSFKTYESAFDFNQYLNYKGVYYQLNIYNQEKVFNSIFRLKSLRYLLLNRLDSESLTFIKQILFGDYDDYQTISNTKIGYLFTTSGVHISFILGIFNKIFCKIKKQQLIYIFDFILMGFLMILLPFKICFLRIFINIIIRLANYKSKRKFDPLTRWSISLIIVVLINYHFVYQTGFILGYLYSLVAYTLQATFKYQKKILRLLVNYLTFAVISGLISSILYSEINITSLIILPFISAKVSITYFLSLIGYLFNISKLILLEAKVYNFLLNIVQTISLNIVVGSHYLLFYLIITGLLIFGLYYFYKHVYKATTVLTSTLALLVLISFIPINNYLIDSISFINVGQGDSILIIHKNTSIVVDVGGNQSIDLATNSLIPYYKKEHLTHIDYCLITHDDADHCGSLESLQNHYTINNIIRSTEEEFYIGDLKFMNLNYDYLDTADENDQSLVLYFSLMGSNWLLMGDASTSVESKIIKNYPDIEVNYLKVGHHGSKTSSSEEFIKFIKPQEAIISVGKNNSYGHPHDEVINRLNRYGINIRRTDIEGTITYTSIKKLFN